jgi:hypothetical protein
MVIQAEIIPAGLVMGVGNATGIEDLNDAEVASRDAT